MQLGRPIHPTIHSVEEYKRGRRKEGSFVQGILATKRIPLIGDNDAIGGAR
jgi:hypothetical protein